MITEAGNDPNVALVYIAGWVPDAGESQENLIARVPSGVPSAGDLIPAAAGRLPVARAGKDACIVRGRPGPEEAAFMADSQVPGLPALSGTISEAAWRSKPSWYRRDRGPDDPPHQRWMSERAGMTVEEAAGSHAIYVSQPAAVAALIEKAASR